jgi:hypothetical protein
MRSWSVASLALAVVLCIAAGHAQADPAPAAPAPSSYRWQLAIADGVAAVSLSTAYEMIDHRAGSGTKAVLALGLGTYLIGGPAIHAAHGQYGRAGLSLVMRSLLPYLGAEIGSSYRPAGLPNDEESHQGLVTGAVVGAVLASLTDVFVVVPSPSAAMPLPAGNPNAVRASGILPAARTAFTLAPSVLVSRDRAMMRLAGSF